MYIYIDLYFRWEKKENAHYRNTECIYLYIYIIQTLQKSRMLESQVNSNSFGVRDQKAICNSMDCK